MSIIRLFFISFIILCFNAASQEVTFSNNRLFNSESIWVELSSTGREPIFYSFLGAPVPGKLGTFEYTQPFLIDSVQQDLIRTSDMSQYIGTTRSTTFYNPGNYNVNALSPKSDTRKTVNLFAGIGDCEEVFIRSFCVGKLPPPVEWQLEIIFDDADEWWNSNTGHYVRGEGLQMAVTDPVLSGLGVDTLKIPNFGVYASKHLFETWYDSVYTVLPDQLMQVGATLVAYKDNNYFGTYDIQIRANGNSTNDYPLKPLAIYFNDSDGPFGGSLKLRKTSTHDIAHLIMDDADMNQDEYDFTVSGSSKFKAHSWIFMDNGNGIGEEFGEYAILEKNGRKNAKERFIIPGKVGKAEVAMKKSGGFLSREDSVFRPIVELFSNPELVNKMTLSELKELINFESVMRALVIVSIGRVHDAWTHNLLAYFSTDQKGQVYVVASDEDGFGRLVTNNRLQRFKINYLGTFLSGDVRKYRGAGYFRNFQDLNNWPKQFSMAVLNHPDASVRNYYQNMLIDIAHSFRKEVMKPIVEKHIDTYFDIFSETMKIDRINGDVDSSHMVRVFDEYLYYADHMLDAWLLDWIELFHPEHTSSDVFKIYGHLNDVNVGSRCGEKGGEIVVNSYLLNDENYRMHVREFGVAIEARANLGWKFSHWVEYPDSAVKFTLYHTGKDDVHLTPVFIFLEDLCNGQDELVLNKIIPWSKGTADILEVYNPTGESVSLVGMYLSDKENNLKHKFSNDSCLIIPARGNVIITFKSDSQSGKYHVSEFGLNKDGESLYLYRQDSTLLMKVSWKESSNSGQLFKYCGDNKFLRFFKKLKTALFDRCETCLDF